MGEVWRAEHRLLRRPAAIKLIRPEALASQANARKLAERFEREAQSTAALSSPHTVDVYDFGVAEDGRLYYAMELLSGVDLETLVQRSGPQSPERVIDILKQVCASLDDAHNSDLVHQDIKPANIFLCQKGQHRDFVKVLDFGLVKLRGETPRDVKVTADETLEGTPAFLSPEAITGKTEVDARSDLYALGCVAYWLLTGRLVFEAKDRMQMVVSHATATPSAPSKHAPGSIPPWLDQVVLSCLAKNPAERPQSALELMRRLECGPTERPSLIALGRASSEPDVDDVLARRRSQRPSKPILHLAQAAA
jgi:serine/threonine-protein kinase